MKNNKKLSSGCSPKQKPKTAYHIRNWKDYNTALVKRGSLTVWFDPDVAQRWIEPRTSGERGACRRYGDIAIACVLTLGAVFHLPLRQQQGFAASVIGLLQVDLPVPDYSTLCRRRQSLSVDVPGSCSLCARDGVPIVVDSTGLKIYGEGEWKVRQHGVSKRRTWRKLHLAVDEEKPPRAVCSEATGEILAAELTLSDVGDGQTLPPLLASVKASGVGMKQVSADGGYDSWDCHAAVAGHGARVAIPPRSGSKIKQHGTNRCGFSTVTAGSRRSRATRVCAASAR